MKTLKKLTPTDLLKHRVEELEKQNSTLFSQIRVLEAKDVLYKEFFSLHFKQGVPSLIKALRQATYSLQQITTSLKGR